MGKKKYLLWELLWQVCYLDATIRFLAVGFPLLRNLHDCRRYLWILNGVVVLLWMKALVHRMDPPSPNDLWNKKNEKKSKKRNRLKIMPITIKLLYSNKNNCTLLAYKGIICTLFIDKRFCYRTTQPVHSIQHIYLGVNINMNAYKNLFISIEFGFTIYILPAFV